MGRNPWVIVMGYPGSGKTTIGEMLRKRGIPVFEFYEYFRQVANLEDKPRGEILSRVKKYIKAGGRLKVITDIVAWAESKTNSVYNGPIVLVGARHTEDARILKSLRPLVLCVLVQATEKERMENIVQRDRLIDRSIINSIMKNKCMKTDRELAECIIEHTNYVIDNSGTLESLETQIEVLLNTLEERYGPRRTSRTARRV